MSPCYNALIHSYLYWVVFFSNREIDAMLQHSEQGDWALDRVAVRLKKNLIDINKNGIDYCKLKTSTYNSFAAIWGLTAIDTILVAG